MYESALPLKGLHPLPLPRPVATRWWELAAPLIVCARPGSITGSSTGNELVTPLIVLVREVVLDVLRRVGGVGSVPDVLRTLRVEEDHVMHRPVAARAAMGV